MWCIHKADAEFVACMEDVLSQYEQPYDPKCLLVCFEERLNQLIEDKRVGIPAKPGRGAGQGYEYRRHGIRNLHMFFEPLAGRRFIRITEQYTMQDFARCMKRLIDEFYLKTGHIRLVLDILKMHTPTALCGTFPLSEAVFSRSWSFITRRNTVVG